MRKNKEPKRNKVHQRVKTIYLSDIDKLPEEEMLRLFGVEKKDEFIEYYVDIDYNDYALILYGERLENDKELQERIKTIENYRIQKEKDEKRIRNRELKMLSKLKKKYEK